MIRARYLDIVKGFSILCIVLLHYEHGIFPNGIEVFVGSFMITAFYVVSGWLDGMNEKELHLRNYIHKRFRQLGIPYLYWSCILIAFDILLWYFNYYDFKYLAKEVYKTFTLRGIGTLWFLPALFGGGIIWQWIKRKGKITLILSLFFTIIYQELYCHFFVGNDTEIVRIIDAPFRTIHNIFCAWIGIAFGYYAYKVTKIKSSLSFLMVGLACLMGAYMTANHCPFSIVWPYIAPLCGPLGLIYFFKSIEKYNVLKYLDYWGKNSLNLMLTHYSITLVMAQIIIDKICHMPFMGWITLVAFLLSIPIQQFFVYFVNRFAVKTLGK